MYIKKLIVVKKFNFSCSNWCFYHCTGLFGDLILHDNSDPDSDPTGWVILNPDPDPTCTCQVITEPDPDRLKVSDPGGSRSATLVKTSVADPDPGSGVRCLLGPWIRDPE
jgi:hypothetical protein